MKIGIVFYTFSGYTLSNVNILSEKLKKTGHDVNIEQLHPTESFRVSETITELQTIPPVDGYDLLILASPVHGGRMAGPMAGYLQNVTMPKDKRVFCLISHFLPYTWGAHKMMGQMQATCKAKGATVIGAENIPQLCLRREKRIEEIVEEILKLIRFNIN